MKNTFTAFMVTLILVGTFVLAFNIQPVKAAGTIYIRADGSIDPPTAPIYTADNIAYTLTGDITSDADGIVIERDNMILDGAGHTVQGTKAIDSIGICLTGRRNVTSKNINIKAFDCGLLLDSSSNNSVSGNNITNNSRYGLVVVYGSANNTIYGNNATNNQWGISVVDSSNNSITGNNITVNSYCGINIVGSSYNTISLNNIADNEYWGISFGVSLNGSSCNNTISGNNISNNEYGIWLLSYYENKFYHNNFIENTQQVHIEGEPGPRNVWDGGYPSGGNYWSDYTDADSYKGEHQNETGGDGVWGHPYVIDGSNQDRYPLTKPFGGPAGDVDGDRDVDIFDIVRMAIVYGVEYPNPQYDRMCDMDLDGDIDIFDVVKAAVNYGKSWLPHL